MDKTITIKGMTCPHCHVRVETALNALDGVSARVNVGAKSAIVTCDDEITNADLVRAVQKAGYDVIKIETAEQ